LLLTRIAFSWRPTSFAARLLGAENQWSLSSGVLDPQGDDTGDA
jgi:hypothetical protein